MQISLTSSPTSDLRERVELQTQRIAHPNYKCPSHKYTTFANHKISKSLKLLHVERENSIIIMEGENLYGSVENLFRGKDFQWLLFPLYKWSHPHKSQSKLSQLAWLLLHM